MKFKGLNFLFIFFLFGCGMQSQRDINICYLFFISLCTISTGQDNIDRLYGSQMSPLS